MDLSNYLPLVVNAIRAWESSWGPFEVHPSLQVDSSRLEIALEEYLSRLTNNYPFFHPRYAGQMLKPPHPVAVMGYLAAMLINPNNHALDGGPATGVMEKEVIRDLAQIFHFPENTLGHLTSSGTVANLEALWVARKIHPEKAIAFSEDAHYTHARMSEVLGVETVSLPTDGRGHLRVDALEEYLKSGRIGTVVLTAGTTGIGAVDPVADVLELRRQFDFRVHIDAAYGGFFSLLAWEGNSVLSEEVQQHFRAIASCDSVVIDPHKHGLQPYGCGCVLFRDPGVGRFYKHDSPYTYFTSNELHLGEISLECSRAGAAAGALWLTLRVMPLDGIHGLSDVVGAGLRAARKWGELIKDSEDLQLFVQPELDILTFFAQKLGSASEVDRSSASIFARAMQDREDPIFLSLFRVNSDTLKNRITGLDVDQAQCRILRSVLMKPEHENVVAHLHARLEELARNIQDSV